MGRCRCCRHKNPPPGRGGACPARSVTLLPANGWPPFRRGAGRPAPHKAAKNKPSRTILPVREGFSIITIYFLSIATTTPDKASSASRFGTAIRPLKRSAKAQTKSTFSVEPTRMNTTTIRL